MVHNVIDMDHYEGLKQNMLVRLKGIEDEGDVVLKLLPHFETLIDSKRTCRGLQQKKSLMEFFVVLEERDELSPTNVDIFFKLMHLLGRPPVSILPEMLQYKKLEQIDGRCNICQSPFEKYDHLFETNKVKKSKQIIEEEDLSDEEEETDVDKAIKKIAPSIGRRWTDLARSLKLKECHIDEIDYDFRRLADKIHKMFETWKEIEGEKVSMNKLRKALVKSRRKDLADSI